MTTINILTLFKRQLVSFIDELLEQFPEEKNLVIVRILVNDQLPIQDIMNYFLQYLLPNKEKVTKRDEEYLINENPIFKISEEASSTFKRIWKFGNLGEDDKEIIFRWVDSFVILTEKYQKSILPKPT